jgi:hypothetical protein
VTCEEQEGDALDIVVTIPITEYENDSIVNDEFFVDEDSCCVMSVSRKPEHLKHGNRVHFVKNNRVEYSMRVLSINGHIHEQTKNVYYNIFLDDLQYAKTTIEVQEFKGFRYKWWD